MRKSEPIKQTVYMQQHLPQAPRNPSGHAPPRRSNSIRRTSSIDVTWSNGRGQAFQLEAYGRDLLTSSDGTACMVVAKDQMLVTMSKTRSIVSIHAKPHRAGIEKLVGARGGGYLRQALNTALPAERDAGSPLYLLLDDLSGTSLVAGWAWSHWQGPDLPQDYQFDVQEWRHREQLIANMEGICSGFRSGSSALGDARGELQNYQQVVELQHPQDAVGWHSMPLQQEPAMRRARRIDVWRDGVIQVEAMFQDSATLPKGGRCAIHEYLLHATVDPQHMTLLSLRAEPRILPYRECPSAVENVGRLLGTPMRELRSAVLEQLPRVLGCTHLNDALRALAEVPLLVQHLQPPFSQPT